MSIEQFDRLTSAIANKSYTAVALSYVCNRDCVCSGLLSNTASLLAIPCVRKENAIDFITIVHMVAREGTVN